MRTLVHKLVGTRLIDATPQGVLDSLLWDVQPAQLSELRASLISGDMHPLMSQLLRTTLFGKPDVPAIPLKDMLMELDHAFKKTIPDEQRRTNLLRWWVPALMQLGFVTTVPIPSISTSQLCLTLEEYARFLGMEAIVMPPAPYNKAPNERFAYYNIYREFLVSMCSSFQSAYAVVDRLLWSVHHLVWGLSDEYLAAPYRDITNLFRHVTAPLLEAKAPIGGPLALEDLKYVRLSGRHFACAADLRAFFTLERAFTSSREVVRTIVSREINPRPDLAAVIYVDRNDIAYAERTRTGVDLVDFGARIVKLILAVRTAVLALPVEAVIDPVTGEPAAPDMVSLIDVTDLENLLYSIGTFDVVSRTFSVKADPHVATPEVKFGDGMVRVTPGRVWNICARWFGTARWPLADQLLGALTTEQSVYVRGAMKLNKLPSTLDFTINSQTTKCFIDPASRAGALVLANQELVDSARQAGQLFANKLPLRTAFLIGPVTDLLFAPLIQRHWKTAYGAACPEGRTKPEFDVLLHPELYVDPALSVVTDIVSHLSPDLVDLINETAADHLEHLFVSAIRVFAAEQSRTISSLVQSEGFGV